MSSSDGHADPGGVVRLLLVLEPDPEVDAERAEWLVRQLRTELAELDITSISAVRAGTVPDDAKGVDPDTLRSIIDVLGPGVVTALFETLRDWLGRHAKGHRISVTIDDDTIELGRASVDQQQQLVDAYVRRHCSDNV